MIPEPDPGAAQEIAGAAEAQEMAAVAVTLETLHEAIAAEAEASEDRQEELLREVKACQTRMEALSASIVKGTESPSTQQMLVQMGQLQTSLEAIQANLAALAAEMTEESKSSGAAENVEAVHLSENSAPNASPSSGKDSGATKSSEGQSSSSSPRESNQSAIPEAPPRKKRYVKI